ncbi:MAG: molybdate ABC transporter permease subunit [Flavobacteriales bacterium]|nr:molybdate ABC transporter permease subunit [Flavobacteriales bacterium]
MDWQAFWLTFKLAAVTTGLLFLISLPVARFLATSRFKGKVLFETMISLPLVLPPTVLGFYLLLSFSPYSALGRWLLETLGVQLVFSFEGLVIASMIYSLPFAVQPIRSGMQNLPGELLEQAAILNLKGYALWTKVLIPNLRSSIIAALILTFAHTVGEFGVVLMIGGNVPGVTRVASIAIYDQVEAMNYPEANKLSIILLAFTFLVMLFMNLLNRNATGLLWKRS